MIILQTIWLFLPAAIANMLAAFSALIFPKWTAPLDFGQKFKGKRILGDHKTIRGVAVGTLAAGLFFWFQQMLFKNYDWAQQISLINYSDTVWLLGCWIGFGALLGDMVKSFFKRQLDIPPGKSWFPFDQFDWLLGAILLTLIFVKLSGLIILITLGLGFAVHLIAKIVGYLIGVSKKMI